MTSVETDNLTERDMQRLSDVVYRHCGINLHDGKRELIRARLAKQMRPAGFSDPGDYLRHVLASPDGPEFQTLIDALSTNLTSFFRENNHFDFLSANLLPRRMREGARTGQRRIRGWSAGCSSGEEAYTLSMVLLEGLGRTIGDWDVKLLASDISTRVLAQAVKGTYEKKAVQTVPPALRDKYLAMNRMDGRVFYTPMPALKNLIAFRHLNLMQPWPFKGSFDFIFCRNVMIYFDKPTQQRLVRRFHDALVPGGVLFTGHSESLTGIEHGLSYVEPTIYAKPTA